MICLHGRPVAFAKQHEQEAVVATTSPDEDSNTHLLTSDVLSLTVCNVECYRVNIWYAYGVRICW